MARIDFSYIQIGHVPLLLIVVYYALILFAAFVHLRRPVLKKRSVYRTGIGGDRPSGLAEMATDPPRRPQSDLSRRRPRPSHPGATARHEPTSSSMPAPCTARTSERGSSCPSWTTSGSGVCTPSSPATTMWTTSTAYPRSSTCGRWIACISGTRSSTSRRLPQTTQLLTQHLETSRIRVEHVPPTIATGPAQVRVLWPAGDSATRQELGENDKSVVCLIEFAGRRVLLCSDIEKPAQAEIARLYPSLKADVVVVPHHGSVRTLDDDFLAPACTPPGDLLLQPDRLRAGTRDETSRGCRPALHRPGRRR